MLQIGWQKISAQPITPNKIVYQQDYELSGMSPHKAYNFGTEVKSFEELIPISNDLKGIQSKM